MEIFVSVVTLWEIAILQEKNRIRLRVGFSAWCDALETYPGLHIEPLMRSDVEEARGLGELPDPHDRLIAGTALRLGVLISQDALLAASGRLRVLW